MNFYIHILSTLCLSSLIMRQFHHPWLCSCAAVSRYHLSFVIQLCPGTTCPFSCFQVSLVLSAMSRFHLSFQLCQGYTCPFSCVQVPLVLSAVFRFSCPFSCFQVSLVLSAVSRFNVSFQLPASASLITYWHLHEKEFV